MPKRIYTFAEREERHKLATKKWRDANKEKARATSRKYYQDNKEKVLERVKLNARRYYDANRRKLAAKGKLWRRENPDQARERRERARARLLESFIRNYRRGLISIDELNRRVSQAFTRTDERIKSERRQRSVDGV